MGTRQKDIDILVATYAPLGQRRRRNIVRKRIATMCATSILAVATTSAYFADVRIFSGSTDEQEQFDELRAMFSQEIDAFSTERQELQQYRRIFEERNELLGTRIDAVNTQWTDLEAQRQQVEAQQALLAETIQDINSKRQALADRRDPAEVLDEEIAAIRAQRIALEKRWQQFEAQGELLATEIIAVNAQRRELNAQQTLMGRQQRQLQALINRAIEIDDRRRAAAPDPADPEPVGQVAQPATEQIAYTGSSVVGDGPLDEMRGGINIGDGLEIAFGVTQTGSINGVEQYSTSFTIDDLSGDVSSIDLTDMNAVLIQNGDGNFASPDVLDALSGSFGGIIQNSLDDQTISTSTIYDISIENVSGVIQGQAAFQALTDTLAWSQ